MPIVTGTYNASIRAANTVMSRAFFTRAKRWLYPALAGSYVSTSLVEPHAVIGNVPPLESFSGQLKARMLQSWTQSVPNLLFKNLLKIRQGQFEGDQTGALVQLSQGMGLALAEFPDRLLATRILTGSNASSATIVYDEDGQTYNLTLDGKAFFNTAHDTWAGGNQSNIIQGSLPATNALLTADDYATNANRMIRDLQNVLHAIKTVKDNQGQPIYPTLDTKESIVVVVPPALEPIAALAFRTPGEALINQTTSVAPQFVKGVMSSGYLSGFVGPESGGDEVSPLNETDWYVFVTDDYVKPFYTQLFRPLRQNEMMPPGYDAGAEVQRILNINDGLSVDQATVFASTRVDTTFRRIGAEADLQTIEDDAFALSCRYRGNITYGPWFTGYRIKPNGGS